MLKKFIFLDRDGVINRDSPDYIKTWSEFEFLPQSIAAITHLTLNGFSLIIITNQSAINRNITTLENVEYIHTRLMEAVKSKGGEIKDVFYCPHTPNEGCDCRKPKPGLIYQAQKKYRIDLADSCMVGDSAKDIECARNAGCGRTILVKTGNGMKAEKSLSDKKIFPDYVAQHLFDAAHWIMKK